MLSLLVQVNKKICDRLSIFEFFKDEDYSKSLVKIIHYLINTKEPKDILEIGGSNRPLITRNKDLYNFYGLDIDNNALCKESYDFYFNQPVEKRISSSFNLIFSKALLEHTMNNRIVVENFYNILKPDGIMVHYIPSKFHPYSIILRLVGPKNQLKIINILRPWSLPLSGYKAYFSYCTPGQMKGLLEVHGFVNVKTTAFYGAKDYFKFLFPFFILIALYDNIMKTLSFDFGASGFIIYCEKPGL